MGRATTSWPDRRKNSPLAVRQAPFMSVIVPNYNGARFLPTVLDGAARQTFRTSRPSSLTTRGPTSPWRWERDYPEVRLLVNRRNVGFVSACNIAADAADGRAIVLLNSDTEPGAHLAGESWRTICAHPTVVVTSKLLLFDDRTAAPRRGRHAGRRRHSRNRGVWETDRASTTGHRRLFSGCGGATDRRGVWQALGGFDEDFWMYLEDVDFAFARGWPVGMRSSPRCAGLSPPGARAAATCSPATTWAATPFGPSSRTCRAGCCWRILPRIVAATAHCPGRAAQHSRPRGNGCAGRSPVSSGCRANCASAASSRPRRGRRLRSGNN
ncbi:MAG: glycosyltransferase [Caldilineaceae bacterium]